MVCLCVSVGGWGWGKMFPFGNADFLLTSKLDFSNKTKLCFKDKDPSKLYKNYKLKTLKMSSQDNADCY